MHQEAHFEQPEFIRDVIIGLSDGITVPFALTAGISGAVDSNTIIITAGLAEICAGAISMGLGGFLAGKTEEEHYFSELAREYREVDEKYEMEKEEIRQIFASYGLSKEVQNNVADELAKDKDKWVEFMMRYELGLEKPETKRARKSALNISVSYVLGGLIPLLGYVFASTATNGLKYSAIITILCLMVFGYFKSKVTGQKAVSGAIKTTVIGIIAAASAFGLAYLFSHR